MSIKTLTEQILNKIPTVGKCQGKFIVHLFSLWFSIRGRHNYINLARYGCYGEDTYRQNASRPFPFLRFNSELVRQNSGTDRMIAFDPTYISKSGKQTAGAGYFYSGCAGREKWGLEFSGIAAIDLSTKTALHLEAVQTFKNPENETLLEFYARQIIERSEGLKEISTLIAADAFFSVAPFVDALTQAGFHLVTRLRKNASMRYLYKGEKRKGPGRPKKYDGKIDPLNLNLEHFSICAEGENKKWITYEAVVNIRSWKRSVRLVVEQIFNEKGEIKSYKLYACTDTEMPGKKVKNAYNARFQIEFLYRDAKQEAGLEHCQARSKEKLHFHINTALTCVSLAKVAYHFPIQKNDKKAFSIADIRNAYANELLFHNIISWFGISPNRKIIKSIRHKIKNFGKRAA